METPLKAGLFPRKIQKAMQKIDLSGAVLGNAGQVFAHSLGGAIALQITQDKDAHAPVFTIQPVRDDDGHCVMRQKDEHAQLLYVMTYGGEFPASPECLWIGEPVLSKN